MGPATRAMAGAGCAGALDACGCDAPVAAFGAAVRSGITGRPTLPLAAVDVVPPSADVPDVAEWFPLAHAASTITVSAQQTSFILPPWKMTDVGQGAERALTHKSGFTCCSSARPGRVRAADVTHRSGCPERAGCYTRDSELPVATALQTLSTRTTMPTMTLFHILPVLAV